MRIRIFEKGVYDQNVMKRCQRRPPFFVLYELNHMHKDH